MFDTVGKGIKNDQVATIGKCPLILGFVSMAIGQYSLGIYKNTLIKAQRNQYPWSQRGQEFIMTIIIDMPYRNL